MAVPTRTPIAAKVEPKSTHVSDPTVQPFLQADFDPATYLNTTLPGLSISSASSRGGRNVSLPDLSAQLQTLLSQLNAQTSRHSTTLTQLTDEIIRSGSRLAYEVELLRGETLGLTDTFNNGLKKDINLLAPKEPVPPPQHAEHKDENGKQTFEGDPVNGEREQSDTAEPEFLQRLRTLTTVRERLDTVIKTFGSAMQWPLAPSEISLASSFISVSGPESTDDSRSREDKGKEHVEKLRQEINELLSAGAEGLRTANERVEELRLLAEVWRGTAEEKARLKLVDNLQKAVDEKQKTLGKISADGARKPGVSPARGYDHRYGNTDAKVPGDTGSGYGFLQNLRNLKNEMYLD
ncbi:hypothetical protein CLAFUW4_04920 [Fulvia fulva]|uniref:Uncharacterized protein n=1 Tax=Passalora fulva TaxID=5499 RepID=A0A9Q8PH74_PASFU|nr:uncharacterized protein CLAFUR5_11985 [Fulvia fulva]KAK4627161.1 hypothetical protein CLAFUR4_04906 [Fulvia fulva]KAK4628584.1 hypothetical protein CLAFUR0_04910 [Fulvia fulva]UJO22455.1 hypothetical protein CLAFUR5_11985 [Fulvia fulva]WPV13751.1 hypothetical protein CLAFUW4_04920 [Fulvia fulva]WPV28875.1 hypothetical protein CLAFUW7_04914 [Fulvia fulva]